MSVDPNKTTSTSMVSENLLGAMTERIKKWPTIVLCGSTTIITLALVSFVAAAGWPGQVASNCYEDYLITADCYCERLRGDKPGDVWIAQPMNTISNLWFVVGGLLIAYASDSRSLPCKEWWANNKNPVTQDKMYSSTFALASCLLGVGSTCLHASFTTWGRQVDMIAMYLLASFSILYPFVKNKSLSRQQGIWAYCVLCTALACWTLSFGTPDQTRRLFTTLIVSSWAIEIFHVDAVLAKHNKEARKIIIANVAFFSAAALIWKSSESGGPLCYPDSLWQGHSLWHLQSAIAITIQFFFYVAEDFSVKETKALYIFENTPHATLLSDSVSESGSVSESSSSQ